jgi:hypothetical protein
VLWLQLIDIKAKQGRQALTSSEKDKRKVTQEVKFNIPQLLCVYLSTLWAIESTQSLTEMSTRDILGVKGGWQVRLTSPLSVSQLSGQCGILIVSQLYSPPWTVARIVFTLQYNAKYSF